MQPLCTYDIAERENLSGFIYDVKILYQLRGHRIRSFHNMCQDFLSPDEPIEYNKIAQRIKAHARSYHECGIRIDKTKLSDFIPQSLLDDRKGEQEKLITRLFTRFTDENVLEFYDQFFPKLQCLHSIMKNMGLKCNFVGSRTGRLSFKPHTFNPYVLRKDQRSCIQARPGYKIYEFDLRSSQPRIAIFSTADDMFKQRFSDAEDIYSLFPGDREDNKISFIRWMYSPDYRGDERFGNFANPIKRLRNALYDSAMHGVIHNRFGRPLYYHNDTDNVVFQNFIASTEADALYEILCSMQKTLAGKKSRILFPFYDAIICEIADDELELADNLRQEIENHYMDHVFFCKFAVKVKAGEDFGHMKGMAA